MSEVMMSTPMQLVLVAFCLVFAVNSEHPDYCQIEEEACPVHVFDVTGYDSSDSFVCNIQPLQHNEAAKHFEPIGQPFQSPAETLNETSVQCTLSGIQSAEVKLDSQQKGHVDTAIIYPTLCIPCPNPLSDCSVYNYRKAPGCLIDSICYPLYVMDPENRWNMCVDFMVTWANVSGYYFDNFFNVAVDACSMQRSPASAKGRSARTPAEAGSWGLDLTADGAYHTSVSPLFSAVFSYFKFYVKFGTEPITEPTTFFEIPSMLKLQRKPDEAIIAEYTLTDAQLNPVQKFVTLREGKTMDQGDATNQGDEANEVLRIGIRLKVNAGRKKRQESPVNDGWNLIALGYDIRKGAALIKAYFNGEEVDVDIGNSTGLFMRPSGRPILSNGVFSCFEYVDRANEIFTSPNFTKCASNVKTEEEYQKCESDFYDK